MQISRGDIDVQEKGGGRKMQRHRTRRIFLSLFMFLFIFDSLLLVQIHAVKASDVVPYDNIGIEWNRNSALVKNDDCWDSRIWDWGGWGAGIQHIYHADVSNYVKWDQDGLVQSSALDDSDALWKSVEFNQGNPRYENEIYNLKDFGWSNKTSSLMVDGSITLFEGIGYAGQNITFTSDVSDLRPNWNDRASSLKLTKGSCVTLYEDLGYVGGSITFQYPSYQPPDLKVSDKSSITLEGVVGNWNTSTNTFPGWTGVKFDVFAVENRFSNSGKILMLEFYILRDGANLYWQVYQAVPGWYGDEREGFRAPPINSIYNYLIATDAFPGIINMTVYPGGFAQWTIDVKAFIQRACLHWPNDLDLNKLSIVKIGFTIEAAWNPFDTTDVGAACSLTRLRLAYTEAPTLSSAYVYTNPIDIVNASLTPGSVFNVSVFADIPVNPGVVGIEFKLTWNASLLNGIDMQENIFHATMPPDEIGKNLWKVQHVISDSYAQYAYTYQDINRAVMGGYAPMYGNHIIATLTFRVKDVGECMLHFNTTNFANQTAQAIPTETIDGLFSNVLPSPQLSVYPESPQVFGTLGPGSVFNVFVQLDTIAFHSGIMGAQFKLTWDPNILEATNATEVVFHEVMPESEWGNIWPLKQQINNTGGYYLYAYTFQDIPLAISGNYAPIYGNHTLAVVTFRVKGIGKCRLQLEGCKVGDVDSNPLSCSVSDEIFNNIIPGDVKRDGVVDILDAILLANALNSGPNSPRWNPDADFNDDKFIDIYDAIVLANHYNQHYT
jgi:hypothetical protein